MIVSQILVVKSAGTAATMSVLKSCSQVLYADSGASSASRAACTGPLVVDLSCCPLVEVKAEAWGGQWGGRMGHFCVGDRMEVNWVGGGA